MRPLRKHQGQDGTSFFVTTVTKDRHPIFKNHSHAKIAEDLLWKYKEKGDFWLGEYVLMPDHLHLLLCPYQKNLSACMRNIKRTISEHIHQSVGQGYPCPTLWQPSFHDIIIRNTIQRSAITHYIYNNPLVSGLCTTVKEYPFSSVHRETDRHRMAAGEGEPNQRPCILLATSNPGKIHEIRECLKDLHLDILEPIDLVYLEETPKETGKTFQENAIHKARFYFDRTGLPTLADDSGIIVEALKGELGIHTRRWGVGQGYSASVGQGYPCPTDAEWIDYFLQRMKREKNKHACFVCHLAYIDQKGTLHTFEGRCEGMITETLEAPYLPGLPISACFKPHSFDTVFSALSIEQKNYTSHRGRALQKFKNFLNERLIFTPILKEKS